MSDFTVHIFRIYLSTQTINSYFFNLEPPHVEVARAQPTRLKAQNVKN